MDQLTVKWKKVKVAQSCPALRYPMDYTIHGILQARILGGNLPNPGINPGLPHCRWILYQLSHKGSPVNCGTWANFPKGLMASHALLYLQFCIKNPKTLNLVSSSVQTLNNFYAKWIFRSINILGTLVITSNFTPLYPNRIIYIISAFGTFYYWLCDHFLQILDTGLKARHIFALWGLKFNYICTRQNNGCQKMSTS